MKNNTITRWLRRSLLSLGLVFAGTAQAQYTSDIDIYAASGSGETPNVLFVLDNSANWGPIFDAQVRALIDAFATLPENKFRVGFMLYTETGNPNSNVDGGYIRSAIRLLDNDYRTKLGAMLSSLTQNADKSNGAKASLAMAEAYLYLAGKTPYAGNRKEDTDYQGNMAGTAQSRAIYALPGNALNSMNANRYNAPVSSGTCERTYIIFISNGPANDNNNDTPIASELLDAAYADEGLTRPPEIVVNGLNDQVSRNKANEWARFMKDSSLAVTTYTIDVNPATQLAGRQWTALLKSMSAASGGEYFAVNDGAGLGDELLDTFTNIFNQMLAADSVFASASLPASTNARGSFRNQVFFGTFRPDARAAPRWRGNLKQYKFTYDPTTDTLFLSDAKNRPAVSGATGFFSPSAESFWTTDSTYWSNQLIGTPPSASDLPDGEVVEKGGVAQRIRIQNATTQANRNVFSCVGCGTNTNLATDEDSQFEVDNGDITSEALAVPDASRSALINWVRGTDNRDDELGPGGTTTIRPSVHGDVLHSRPAVVDYGGNTGVVVFYGANDGMLRAVNANNTVNGGNELWGFIPEEHFPRLKRLYDNSPSIRLSTTLVLDEGAPDAPTPRDYFVDGPISFYQKLTAPNAQGEVSTEKAILYFGMRRGGRLFYALDVTDPTQPRYLWRKTSTNIPVLGQTWSEARVARVRGNTNPVLVMGAGYDAAAEDAATPGATTMGNAVLVLDAFTGELLKTFETDRSVPADISVVDSDFDGYVDRAYAADVGGNIYRIDFEQSGASPNAVGGWEIFKFAELAGGNTRKFLYAPDVVITKNFTAVMVGSGDREKPLADESADAFFTVFDRNVAKGTPEDTDVITFGDLARVGTDGDRTKGCYIPMDVQGEKVVNAPVTVGGVTYFGTNRPLPATECRANLGQAKVYAAPLFCAQPEQQILLTGGLPPSPVAGTVEVSFPALNEDGEPILGDDGNPTLESKRVPFVIGGINDKQAFPEPTLVKPPIPPQRRRSYWYLENAR